MSQARPKHSDESLRHRLRARWPLAEQRSAAELLLDRYGSADRGYHDLRHLQEVLDRLDELSTNEPFDREQVLLAAWFHDGVYDGQPAAEERSADLAKQALGNYEDLAEVVRLVRLTTHHDPEPGDRNGSALCDADLAILAAPTERYAQYSAEVRREYAQVADELYASARAEILSALAARERLFGTGYAHRHWDGRARRNLAAEIAQLRGQIAASDGA